MMKFNLVLVIFVMVSALLLAFCIDDSVSDPLDGTSWVLFAYRKSKPIPGKTITADFEDGQVHGSAGCNTYSGNYAVSAGNISFENLVITLMACLEPQGIMEQEQMIMQFIRDAQTYQLSGEQLMIFRSDGEALTFVPKE